MSKKGETCRKISSSDMRQKLNTANCPDIDIEYKKERGGGLVQDVQAYKIMPHEAIEKMRDVLVEGMARGIMQWAIQALQSQENEKQEDSLTS